MPDIRLHLGSLPPDVQRLDTSQLQLWHASVATDQAGRPRRCIWRLPHQPYYLLQFFDGHRFVFDHAATEVWGEWPSDSTLEDTLTYLLGPVIGVLLKLRGITCLHASCVQLGDGCIALVGEPEAGKSTTAAAFALAGKTFLSDDITTLERDAGEIVARPAYPRIRLWPASAAVLGIPVERLPRLTPTWDKRYLDVDRDGLAFSTVPVPVQAVYLLSERMDEPARPYLLPTTRREALLELITNVFLTWLPDEGRSVQDFPILAELATKVPIRRVFPHSEPDSIVQLCRVLEQDFAALRDVSKSSSYV